MAITREQLYEEVWSEPALRVATRHDVSSSYLARVCDALNVPRPPRGYWAMREFGKAPQRPPLPACRPGDETQWSKGAGLPLRVKGTTFATSAEGAPSHPLVVGVKEQFEVGWVTRQWLHSLPHEFGPGGTGDPRCNEIH